MANPEHVDILRQGAEVWNRWREKHPQLQPDLSGADLNEAELSSTNFRDADFFRAHLSGADLSLAILRRADLRSADLSSANLRRADLDLANLSYANLSSTDLSNSELSRANLSNANLSTAELSNANLSSADLSGATLSNANLSNANLSDAILDYTRLTGADLNHAKIGLTLFGAIDLRPVAGLETVEHQGPSTIGVDTILKSEGDIPEIFLRGAGLDDIFISYVLSLARKPIQYYSYFISYSSKDQAFAERLYADLQNNNVRCWYAPEDLKIGDKLRSRTDEAIHIQDKLLLLLSEHALASSWVEDEVEAALEKEEKQQREVLFPVRLDNEVMQTSQAWAAKLHRTRHIGDFTRWKEHDEYQKGLNRLLRDLKQEAIHDTIESDAHKD